MIYKLNIFMMLYVLPLVLLKYQNDIILLFFTIGGSESFENKRKYFYDELKKIHSIKTHQTYSLKISRDSILKDVSICFSISPPVEVA